jgi:multidrug resistance efflux pump
MHTAAWLMATVVLAAQPTGETRPKTRDAVTLPHCIVSLIDQVELPAQLSGVLVEVTAKKGMLVRKDQLLGRIDDTMAQVRLKSVGAKLTVVQKKAEDDSPVKLSEKLVEYYLAVYDESVAINKRSPNSIAEATLRTQVVQWEKGKLESATEALKLEVAKLEQKVAEVEVLNVRTELKQREIRSPFDGVIVELLRQQSEWVKDGEPLLKVVNMDRLRVEGFLPADEYAPEQVLGARATVKVRVADREPHPLGCTVDFVSPLVEASGDYRVFAEIENPPGRGGYPWLVRPGSDVEMTIQLKKPEAPATRTLREQ